MSHFSRLPIRLKLTLVSGLSLVLALTFLGLAIIAYRQFRPGGWLAADPYLPIVATLASVAAFGAGLAFSYASQRSICEPLRELAEAAGQIADQHGASPPPATGLKDEVSSLAIAFKNLRDGLTRRDVELRATHEELEKQIKEGDEGNQLKDQFLATLSHELRTPLNAILGWAHILRRGGLDREAMDRALETISSNAVAQGQIVADILDLQQIAGGKLQLDLQPLDLAVVVRRAVQGVTPAARAKEIEIQTLIGSTIDPIQGDEERLQQVIGNLLSNAVKYAPHGGRVCVELLEADRCVKVQVEDTGPGLDPAFIPFTFDRFRQAAASNTRGHGGLGIGLALVRHLVELHGGSVSARNRAPGAGAQFVISLPRAAKEQTPRPERDSHARPNRSPRIVAGRNAPSLEGVRVLVADDDPDSSEITVTVLARSGAQVTMVASAAEAVTALLRDRPHVFLSDIEMPGEDGYSLMRRIRLLPPEEGGSTPAVALTAYAGVSDRVRALAAGFQMHLAKPVQPLELAAVVASLARGPLPNETS